MSGRMFLQAIRLSNEDFSPPISMAFRNCLMAGIPQHPTADEVIEISDKTSSIETLKHQGMCVKVWKCNNQLLNNCFPSTF